MAALRDRLARPTPWPDILTQLACWPLRDDPGPAIALVEAALDRWPPHTRHLTAIAAQQLLADDVRPYLRLLGALDLRMVLSHRDRPALLLRMIHAGGLRHLVTLTTRYDHGDELAAIVAAHITGLRDLHLGGSHLATPGAAAIAAAPALSTLERLDLHNNDLVDADADALIASPHLHRLRWLNLYGNHLSSAARERVRTAPQWSTATILDHNQRLR
jgi:hypothetical protein